MLHIAHHPTASACRPRPGAARGGPAKPQRGRMVAARVASDVVRTVEEEKRHLISALDASIAAIRHAALHDGGC